MRKNDTVESRKVAEVLGIDNSTMSRWITTGRFRAVEKIGRSWHFRTADLISWSREDPRGKGDAPASRRAGEEGQGRRSASDAPAEEEMIAKKIASAIDEVYGEETL